MSELTKEQIGEIAAEAAGRVVAEMQEPIRKFQPGGGEVEITKDEGDQKFKSVGDQLMAVKDAYQTGRMDPRLRRLVTGETKATGLNEGIPAEGGFLIDTEFVPRILERTYEYGVLASRCTRIPIGANYNGITMPAIDESSLASTRFGGILAYWLSEAGTKTASKPKFRRVKLELNKLIGLCYATDELLQDAVALEAWLMRAFPMEFGFRIDDAIINGDGAGKPLGIMSAPALVSVTKETGQPADTVLAENVIKMYSRMWAPSRSNSVWLINQDVEPQLHTMSIAVGTGGIPVYMPAGGLSQSPYASLYGRPVLPIWQCATVGTTGDIMFVDLSQYLLAEKGGIETASSIHVKFVEDETAFRFVMRLDGQPWWNSALTPYKGSSTLSPFVCLESRT